MAFLAERARTTTRKAQQSDKAPDLVKRDFTVATVNKSLGG